MKQLAQNVIVQTPYGRGIVRRFLAERYDDTQYDTYKFSDEVVSVSVAFPSSQNLKDWGMGGSNSFNVSELTILDD